MKVLLLLASVLIGLSQARGDIACDSWGTPTPLDGQEHFKFSLSAHHYQTGEAINIILQAKNLTDKKIHGFLLQAHDQLDQPVGHWELGEINLHHPTPHRIHTCRHPADTVTNGDGMSSTFAVQAMWYPPANVSGDLVDFNAAVWTMVSGNKVRNNIRSIEISPIEEAVHDIEAETAEEGASSDEETPAHPSDPLPAGTGEDPNEQERLEEEQRQLSEQLDHHDGIVEQSYRDETEEMLKYKEKIQKEIEAEDAESEGDWQRKQIEEQEKEEKERQDEEIRYEMEKAEEEDRRQHMMQLEIKDKEEHDKLMAEQEKNKPTDKPKSSGEEEEPVKPEDEIVLTGDDSDITAGVSRVIFSVTTILMSVLATIL